MTQIDHLTEADDRFGLWYRVRSLVVFNLLYVAGPAQLDRHNDPRAAVEQDYERRRDLHRERHGKAPVAKATASNGGADPVVLCAVGGVLALGRVSQPPASCATTTKRLAALPSSSVDTATTSSVAWPVLPWTAARYRPGVARHALAVLLVWAILAG